MALAHGIYDVTRLYSYKVTELDFGKIETFVIPNEDETVRVRDHVNLEDTIEIAGTAAIAVITRNEPFSTDTIRITRDDLNAVIKAPDIINLEICSIHFDEIRADTLVFSLALTIPDSDKGYFIICHHYDKKNHFDYNVITLDDNFLDELKTDRQIVSDSMRCVRVVESEIYNESSSSMYSYIPLFNYLIKHQNKEFDDGISIDLYKMFSKFPEKQNEFNDYLMLLQKDEQDKVVENLTKFLLPEYLHELNISKVDEPEDFKRTFLGKFPFLQKYDKSRDEIDFYLKRQSKYH